MTTSISFFEWMKPRAADRNSQGRCNYIGDLAAGYWFAAPFCCPRDPASVAEIMAHLDAAHPDYPPHVPEHVRLAWSEYQRHLEPKAQQSIVAFELREWSGRRAFDAMLESPHCGGRYTKPIRSYFAPHHTAPADERYAAALIGPR